MNYQDFQLELTSHVDDAYREFAAKGTPTHFPFLGVRMPVLRELSAKIIKNHVYEDFLAHDAQSFEEITMQGIIIASLPYDEMLKYFTTFVQKIDNWGTCDTFCNTAKSIRQHRADFLPYLDKLLSGSEFEVRTALVILLNHYLDNPNMMFSRVFATDELSESPQSDGRDEASRESIVFGSINKVKNREEYYIRMAIAWLVAECFIKHPDETWEYLATADLPKWTQNKAISKIRDSYRVDQTLKDALLTLRK